MYLSNFRDKKSERFSTFPRYIEENGKILIHIHMSYTLYVYVYIPKEISCATCNIYVYTAVWKNGENKKEICI